MSKGENENRVNFRGFDSGYQRRREPERDNYGPLLGGNFGLGESMTGGDIFSQPAGLDFDEELMEAEKASELQIREILRCQEKND